MAETIKRITIDAENDFGGRSEKTLGVSQGIPIILDLLKRSHISGLFFISTELLSVEGETLSWIRKAGHEIGAHGHHHVCYKEAWRAEEDKEISKLLLNARLYRAPKFYHAREDSVYSNPKNHVSLLKHCWFGTPIKKDTIFYMHPFDIVRSNERPPNLFCSVWYSQPEFALKKLREVIDRIKNES